MAYACINNSTHECDGCGACMENPVFCPVCGKACDVLYKHDGETVGCDRCVKREVA